MVIKRDNKKIYVCQFYILSAYDIFYNYLRRKLSLMYLINFAATVRRDCQYYFYFLIMSQGKCIIMLFVNPLHVFSPLSGNRHACMRVHAPNTIRARAQRDKLLITYC